MTRTETSAADAASEAAVASQSFAAAAPPPDAAAAQAPAEVAMADEIAEPVAVAPRSPAAPHGSLGQRLRAAREANGWSVSDVGSRLRLPVQIVHALEAEQYEKIGYGIYLRGYLTSYARLVDVPTVLVDAVVRDNSQAPPLVASGTISHSRYLYQRYSVSALYLILTGVIIVPAVLLAMRASLQPNAGEVATLDAAPASSVAVPAQAADAAAHADEGSAQPAPAANAAATETVPAETPLVASLAPFSALTRKEPVARTAAPAAAPTSGAHTLKLSLKEASWVEVTASGGDKLEYGLLPAGSVRSYTSDKPLDVRLGNSSGAEVETDGVAQDLAPYRHSNVAHFRLFTAGEAISHTD